MAEASLRRALEQPGSATLWDVVRKSPGQFSCQRERVTLPEQNPLSNSNSWVKGYAHEGAC
jgi:hypothetical protein